MCPNGVSVEELLACPGKEDGDLIFIILLVETSIVENHKLSNPS
jgi:hypothetical protein